MTPVPISVVVVSRNEAELLDRCLAAVHWCDDVVVLDMECTDRTRQVAADHGARVVAVPLRPIAEQVRQRGLDVARHEWVLQLDPDEVAPPRLPRQLLDLVLANPGAAVVRWPFTEHAFGQPLGHLLRGAAKVVAVHTGRVRYPDLMRSHEEPERTGPVLDAASAGVDPIAHHAYRDVTQVAEKMVRYGTTGNSFESGLDTTALALPRLLLRYLVRREAWRDGAVGVQVASMLAIQDYVALLARREDAGAGPPPLGARTRRGLSGLSHLASAVVDVRARRRPR